MVTYKPWNIYKILTFEAYYKWQNYLQLNYATSITTYHIRQNSQYNTNSTEHSPYWKANSSLTSHEIPLILCNLKPDYHVHKSITVCILNRMEIHSTEKTSGK